MAFDGTKTYTGGTAADDAGTVNFFNSFRFQYGTAAARPAAGNQGIFYFATDTGVMSYDTGAAWVDCRSAPIAVTITDKSPTKDGTWRDVDLSVGDFVPAGTKAVQVTFSCTVNGGTTVVGARKNGSAETKTWALGATGTGYDTHLTLLVEVDSSRILEMTISNENGFGFISEYMF